MQCYVIINFFQVASAHNLKVKTVDKLLDINITEPISTFICVCVKFHDCANSACLRKVNKNPAHRHFDVARATSCHARVLAVELAFSLAYSAACLKSPIFDTRLDNGLYLTVAFNNNILFVRCRHA